MGFAKLKIARDAASTKNPFGAEIIDDAYNANPDSMKAALSSCVREDREEKAAVLGTCWS